MHLLGRERDIAACGFNRHCLGIAGFSRHCRLQRCVNLLAHGVIVAGAGTNGAAVKDLHTLGINHDHFASFGDAEGFGHQLCAVYQHRPVVIKGFGFLTDGIAAVACHVEHQIADLVVLVIGLQQLVLEVVVVVGNAAIGLGYDNHCILVAVLAELMEIAFGVDQGKIAYPVRCLCTADECRACQGGDHQGFPVTKCHGVAPSYCG